ncbi:hypothetical protein CYMTET_36211 [Cymbomonas tetramitiformis]|uniref:EF-hand domain-containing protein n=1 Tax=Cymbomonas tetramitiformis TaxID=36881 RepID=A0AAE0CIL5_9CHLO|nr:hypothetical protein CYMTET_36211 [Cymbomonas tetramitiformis]
MGCGGSKSESQPNTSSQAGAASAPEAARNGPSAAVAGNSNAEVAAPPSANEAPPPLPLRVDTTAEESKKIQHELDREIDKMLNAEENHALHIADKNAAIAQFEKLDADGSGKLEFEEVKKLLTNLGLNIEPEQFDLYAEAMLKHIDKNSNKCVDKKEFVKFYSKILKSEETRVKFAKKLVKEVAAEDLEKSAKAQFAKYDANGDGTIDKKEMSNVLRNCLQLELTDEQWEHYTADIFDKADKDTSGALEFVEFLNFYKKCLASSQIREKYESKVVLRYQNGQWEVR